MDTKEMEKQLIIAVKTIVSFPNPDMSIYDAIHELSDIILYYQNEIDLNRAKSKTKLEQKGNVIQFPGSK